MLQITMLSGFILYCDCPWATYLDAKIALFYLMVCHITLTSSYLSQLFCYEIIGLLSFRLIGHYLDRTNAIRGSHIATGTNRIADVLLALIFAKVSTSVSSH
jgi:NADH:ubiquinone oxidoreductase subunit 5 (subunit L)/multisubunit Na+/H+ antiporter MnhA subunit